MAVDLKRLHDRHVAAIYPGVAQAQDALTTLRKGGIDPQHLSLVGQETADSGRALRYTTIVHDADTPGMVKTAWNDLLQWLLGFTILVTAGGALVLFGPMAYAMVVSTEERAFAGVGDVLTTWGMSAREAEEFGEAVREGKCVVVVSGDEDLTRKATQLLSDTPFERIEAFAGNPGA